MSSAPPEPFSAASDHVVLFDERCALHTVPPGFPERPERVANALEDLEALDEGSDSPHGYWSRLALHRRSDSERDRLASTARSVAERVHDPAYLERWEAAVAAGQRSIDTSDNPLSPGTADAAWAAAECALWATGLVRGRATGAAQGAPRHAFSLTRPPGHHCERDRAMGFCYLNQVAIAAQWLVDEGCERVAIVDFDVHHGNGTQHLFEARPDVLYVSLHQWPFYPGTGAAGETGVGAGEGATLNVPLPAGSGDRDYAAAMTERVLPALDRFAPEALLISAGFDAWKGDPLGGMRLTESAYFDFGRRLQDLAEAHCEGRLVSVLEGGYDLSAMGRLIDAYLRGVAGVAESRSGGSGESGRARERA